MPDKNFEKLQQYLQANLDAAAARGVAPLTEEEKNQLAAVITEGGNLPISDFEQRAKAGRELAAANDPNFKRPVPGYEGDTEPLKIYDKPIADDKARVARQDKPAWVAPYEKEPAKLGSVVGADFRPLLSFASGFSSSVIPFDDEIFGVADALREDVSLDEAIKARREGKKIVREENPYSNIAGSLAPAVLGIGAGLTASSGPALGVLGREIPGAAKIAANPGWSAALGGAAQGALFGAGEADDNRLGGAAIGAGTGFATGAVLGAIGKSIASLAEKATRKANARALETYGRLPAKAELDELFPTRVDLPEGELAAAKTLPDVKRNTEAQEAIYNDAGEFVRRALLNKAKSRSAYNKAFDEAANKPGRLNQIASGLSQKEADRAKGLQSVMRDLESSPGEPANVGAFNLEQRIAERKAVEDTQSRLSELRARERAIKEFDDDYRKQFLDPPSEYIAAMDKKYPELRELSDPGEIIRREARNIPSMWERLNQEDVDYRALLDRKEKFDLDFHSDDIKNYQQAKNYLFTADRNKYADPKRLALYNDEQSALKAYETQARVLENLRQRNQEGQLSLPKDPNESLLQRVVRKTGDIAGDFVASRRDALKDSGAPSNWAALSGGATLPQDVHASTKKDTETRKSLERNRKDEFQSFESRYPYAVPAETDFAKTKDKYSELLEKRASLREELNKAKSAEEAVMRRYEKSMDLQAMKKDQSYIDAAKKVDDLTIEWNSLLTENNLKKADIEKANETALKLKADLEKPLDTWKSIYEFERQLGVPVDEWDGRDVPGVYTRLGSMSDSDRASALQMIYYNLFAQYRHAMTGAAASQSEMEQMYKTLPNKSEAQLIHGIQQFKRDVEHRIRSKMGSANDLTKYFYFNQ